MTIKKAIASRMIYGFNAISKIPMAPYVQTEMLIKIHMELEEAKMLLKIKNNVGGLTVPSF